MRLISSKEELIKNIETLENYLVDGNDQEQNEAIQLIKRGICFVAYIVDDEIRFAPSRFLGYQYNTIDKHKRNESKNGNITNQQIIKILQSSQVFDKRLESKFIEYCRNLGITPRSFGKSTTTRRYWKIEIEKDFDENRTLPDGFPEGKLVLRIHLARERNFQVVNLAKAIFKSKHGKFFCQICGFDFEKVYGSEPGKDFIEAHHTIAISEMVHEHKTKVEEIALLCSNCHSMVHRRRPWLGMEDMKKILK